MSPRSKRLLGLWACLFVGAVCHAEIHPTEGYLPKFSRRVKPAARARIPLVVHFPDLPGVNELPAVFGVPFPRGALKSAENVRMVAASGKEIPCVVRRTATWERKDGDVRWVLIKACIQKGETYFLEYGAAVNRGSAGGSLSVNDSADAIAVNTGPLRLVFSRTNSTLISEAKLNGRTILSPGRQKRMTLTDESGNVIETSDRPGDYRIEIEQSDSLHAVIKATGWYRRPNGEKMMQYVARIHAYAGRPFVRIVHTFVVNYDTEKVRLKDICIPLVLNSAMNARATFGLDLDDPAKARQMAEGHLLQDHYKHFALRARDGKTVAEGKHAAGWFNLSTRDTGLTIGLRHVWQEYPKELEVAGAEMRVHLWPPHGRKLLDFDAKAQLGPKLYKQWNRVYHGTLYEGGVDKYDQAMGLAKTNELVLSFHTGGGGAAPESAISHCMTLEKPLVVCADPDWMCKSDVFGRLCARKSSRRPDVERKIELGFASFDQRRRDREGYGMIHYGDVHGKGPNKGWRQWASRFYGSPLLPWIMFVRTGEPRYLMLAMDSAKHVMDIDMCHVTNLKYGDYGPRCPKSPGKRRGGRYGGDGGIIHYSGHLYDLGCDSHVDQWTYAYYLTGYRRAWDILHEEGDYYLQLDKEKLSSPLRRYDTRMTGGALRALTTLYQATWDERYLTLVRRVAEHFYTGTNTDGTSKGYTKYDGSDTYMNPGMFTYYQTTGDERMRHRLLNCIRMRMNSRKPVHDARLWAHYYGHAMAFFLTGDTTCLNWSVGWLNDFLASPDGSGGHLKLTVQLNYLPYLLEALAACDKPIEPITIPTATNGEILLRRDDKAPFTVRARWSCYDPMYMTGAPFRDWPEYCRRNKITARVVIRDAGLREVAGRDINVVARTGELDLSVPSGPPGVYRLAIDTSQPVPMRLFLLKSSLKKTVYSTSPNYVAHGCRYYFAVPKGRRKSKMAIRAQILRTTLHVEVLDPNGRSAAKWKRTVGSNPVSEYVPIGWNVPAGADGKIWSFTVLPTDRLGGLYIKLDGPPWLAASADAFFIPQDKLAPRSALVRPAADNILNIPAGKALTISRGAEKAPGRYERLAVSAGTIEFRLRPGWALDDLRDLRFVRCGKLTVYRRCTIGTYLYVGGRGNQSGFILAPGYWYHMAIVWSADEKQNGRTAFRLYVNGVSLGTLSAVPDWAGPGIRIGAHVPLDIAGLRVSDVARYKQNFDVGPAGLRDGHTLVQLDFAKPLLPFAEVR